MELITSWLVNEASDGVQYSIIEENDKIYDFLTRLNPKFDVVRERILGQRPIPSLMEAYYEICLEEDHTIAYQGARLEVIWLSPRR